MPAPAPARFGAGIDTLAIPAGSLCIVNELAGEVWFADRTPQRQWLRDAELDAWAATVTDHTEHRPPGVPAMTFDT